MPDQASTRPCCHWATQIEPHLITFASPRRKKIALDALTGGADGFELFKRSYRDFSSSRVIYGSRPARKPTKTSAIALAYSRVTDRSVDIKSLANGDLRLRVEGLIEKPNSSDAAPAKGADRKSLVQQIFTQRKFSDLVEDVTSKPPTSYSIPDDSPARTTNAHSDTEDHNLRCRTLLTSGNIVVLLSDLGLVTFLQWIEARGNENGICDNLVNESIVWTFGQSWMPDYLHVRPLLTLRSITESTKSFLLLNSADKDLQNTFVCLEAMVRRHISKDIESPNTTWQFNARFLVLPIAALIARAGGFNSANYGNVWSEFLDALDAVDSERYGTVETILGKTRGPTKGFQNIVLSRPAIGLAEAVIDYIAACLKRALLGTKETLRSVTVALTELLNLGAPISISDEVCASYPADNLVLWARYFLQRHWNEDAKITSDSAIVNSLIVLSFLYEHRAEHNIPDDNFYVTELTKCLKSKTISAEWLKSKAPPDDPNSPFHAVYAVCRPEGEAHLLDFPWLFEPEFLVLQFRNICQSLMYEAFVEVKLQDQLVKKYIDDKLSLRILKGEELFRARKQAVLDMYSVLVVSRDAMLKDTFNQLWRRSQWELRKPLKILLGYDSGEQGADQGGPLVELFQQLVKEMLDENLGLFQIDLANQMMSLVPRAWLPTWQIQMTGVIFGLAVFNNISIPVNFPLAFYRLLLGLKNSEPDHIKDGWPELAYSFDMLKSWQHSDVEEVFMREYVYETDNGIERIKVDMTKCTELPERTDRDVDVAHSSTFLAELPQCEDPPFVNSTNKRQFVKDYIFWLTDASIRPEFNALAEGFFTVVPRGALSLFTPEQLKLLVEGTPVIDVSALRLAAPREQDDLDPEKQQVLDWFWEVAATLAQEELRKLLTFVTASERVSPRGAQHMKFVVVIGGADDTQLPTAMTCFGYLTIPAYSSKEILEQRLRTALEHTIGFGSI